MGCTLCISVLSTTSEYRRRVCFLGDTDERTVSLGSNSSSDMDSTISLSPKTRISSPLFSSRTTPGRRKRSLFSTSCRNVLRALRRWAICVEETRFELTIVVHSTLPDLHRRSEALELPLSHAEGHLAYTHSASVPSSLPLFLKTTWTHPREFQRTAQPLRRFQHPQKILPLQQMLLLRCWSVPSSLQSLLVLTELTESSLAYSPRTSAPIRDPLRERNVPADELAKFIAWPIRPACPVLAVPAPVA